MKTIHVLLDIELLRAVDAAARQQKVNRSAFIRQTLREHLNRLNVLDREACDRRGYEAKAQRSEEVRVWEEAAVWPED